MTVAGKTCREPCMGGAIYNYGERLENPDENLVLIGFYKIVTVLICKNHQKLVVENGYIGKNPEFRGSNIGINPEKMRFFCKIG